MGDKLKILDYPHPNSRMLRNAVSHSSPSRSIKQKSKHLLSLSSTTSKSRCTLNHFHFSTTTSSRNNSNRKDSSAPKLKIVDNRSATQNQIQNQSSSTSQQHSSNTDATADSQSQNGDPESVDSSKETKTLAHILAESIKVSLEFLNLLGSKELIEGEGCEELQKLFFSKVGSTVACFFLSKVDSLQSLLLRPDQIFLIVQ